MSRLGPGLPYRQVATDIPSPLALMPAQPTGDAHDTSSQPRRPLVFALLLTGLAGFLDAMAFFRFDHLYVSFMSGNSIHLGITIAECDLSDMLIVLGVVASFIGGAGIGRWIADHSGDRLIVHVLGFEVSLLVVAVLFSVVLLDVLCLMVVALTMGVQNHLHQAVGRADLGKGFVTGMLFRLGQLIVRLPSDAASFGNVTAYFLNWLAFVVGAACGVLAVRSIGLTGCLIVAVALITALLVHMLRTIMRDDRWMPSEDEGQRSKRSVGN